MLMKAPIFPVPSSLIEQACTFNNYSCGQVFELGDGIVIRTGELNHPNGACGYRIEFAGKSIAICTDTEHFEDRIDQNVVSLSHDADVMVYDAAYTDEDYPKFKGWGHSTWQEAVKVAEAANVKQTFLFHHDPRMTMTRWIALRKKSQRYDQVFVRRLRARKSKSESDRSVFKT
jgi:phosphoribosyl 1,2-cyclic phosphodiesterase